MPKRKKKIKNTALKIIVYGFGRKRGAAYRNTSKRTKEQKFRDIELQKRYDALNKGNMATPVLTGEDAKKFIEEKKKNEGKKVDPKTKERILGNFLKFSKMLQTHNNEN